MTCIFNQCIIFLITLLMTFTPSFSEADPEVFRIPRVEGITVDGSAGDWGKQGFRVEILTDPDGRTLPVDDFDAKFRLAWDQKGLYMLAVVRDDIAVEHENISRLWRTDCVEIFVSEYVGSTNRYQVVVASGADPKYKTVRQKIYDWRHPRYKTSELSARSGSRVFEGSYVIEALLPWENLGVKPDTSTEIGFQFVANDDDGNSADSNGSLRVAWFAGLGPTSRLNMYRLKLSDKSSEAVLCRIDRKISLGRCVVSVLGSSELIGLPVALRSAEGIIDQGTLDQKNGRASIKFDLDSAEYTDAWPRLDVVVEDKTAAAFEALSTLDRILERYIQALGGRTAIEKLTSRVCTGKYVDDLSWADPPVQAHSLKAFAKIPDKWVTTLQVSKGTEQNGYDGSIGWKQNPDRIERNNRMSRSWLGYLLNPQGVLRIQEYFPAMTLETKEMFGGRSVYLVKNETQNVLYFDAESGLLSRIGLPWELQDYREVDGVKFPFRIATSRKGGESYFAFDKIEHNVPIDDRQFAIPDAGDVFADAFEGIEDSKVLPMLKMKDLSYEHGEMNVPCRDGRFLYELIIRNGYTRGLEIGTFNGYSTLWLGLAFRRTGGRVITIEYDRVSGEEARKNFGKAGLEDVIDSRINDAFEEIPKIEGNFDFVFIDAWKPDYVKFLHLLKDRISPGGAIVAHNVTNQARDMQEFLEAIRNDPTLETTFHEISEEGFSMSITRK
ncbi:MAG: class I SAM-dependent methyltransferase [Candidatus Aminicenantes bacterium]|nr:class I SAM-dependent methyltransferase [Candidatus Aminicenantes bacterium]